MYYYGARYYDPRISIFVSVDPLVEETMTPYQYVLNNPINLIDPTGMIWEDPKERKMLEDNVKAKIERHEAEIANLTESLTTTTKEKEINSINAKISDFNERIELLNQSLTDIELIEKDSRGYKLESLSSTATNAFVHGIDNKVYIQGSNTEEYLHEIRHIGQYLEQGRGLRFTPKDGFNRLKNGGRSLQEASFYEVQAYKIQAAYGGNSSVGMRNVDFIKDIDAAKINRNKRHSNGEPMYPFIEAFLKE